MQWYGESEFWLSLGKVLLSIGLIVFTFIVMLGGNPLNDRFGFRYWQNPGSFAEHYSTGSLGRWLGFLYCFIKASFTIAGPDYVSVDHFTLSLHEGMVQADLITLRYPWLLARP